MKLSDLAVLTIRISGLVLFVLTIAGLPEYLKSYLVDGGGSDAYVFWQYFLPIVIPGIVSLLLFCFPYSIANKIVIKLPGSKESEYNLFEIELILIKLSGLVLIYFAASDLILHMVNILIFKREFGNDFSMRAYNYPYLVADIFKFFVALWLIIGTRSIAKTISNLRQK